MMLTMFVHFTFMGVGKFDPIPFDKNQMVVPLLLDFANILDGGDLTFTEYFLKLEQVCFLSYLFIEARYILSFFFNLYFFN